MATEAHGMTRKDFGSVLSVCFRGYRKMDARQTRVDHE